MSRASLKLWLYFCAVIYVITTVFAMTDARFAYGTEADVLFFFRLGSFVLGIVVAIWLMVTRKRPAN